MGAAMAARQPDQLALHFTEDAFLKFPGAEPVKGRKAIEQVHREMLEQGVEVRPTTKEVQVTGDLAYEIGTYEFRNREGEKLDQGNYATIWKKEDGKWRISRDVVSSSMGKKSSAENLAQEDSETEHLYVELWNPKQAWLDLSKEERQNFFDEVGGEIQNLMGEGVEVLGFAVNDEGTPFRSDHQYIAVWKMPSKDQVNMLEESVSRTGWYDYFDQVNARGKLISPPVALEDMVLIEE